MKRYIEISELPNFEVKCSDGKEYVLLPFKHLFDIPTADVAEVKHGYNKSSMNPVDEFICSECGAMFADVSLVKEDEENGDINYYEFEFKYCPNCGAKMSEIPTGSERGD